MNDIKMQAVEQALSENTAANTAATTAAATTPAPAAPAVTTPAPAVAENKEISYEERLKQNLETGFDPIKQAQSLIGKYAKADTDVFLINKIVQDAAEEAKELILKPGYDPSKYADLVNTNSEKLIQTILANRQARQVAQAEDERIDRYNALDEFGANNMGKAEDALKWYAEVKGIPVELVKQESIANKAAIYKAFNSGKVLETKDQVYNRSKDGAMRYLEGIRE